MTETTREVPTALVAVLVVAAVAGVGGVAATASSSSGATLGHDNGVGANYTVALPDPSDHYPGDENRANASIWHLATGEDVFEKTSSPEGLERLDYVVVRSQAIDFSSCSTSDTRAFGVDRGNDDDGTRTDEDLLAHREDSSFNDHSIVVKFWDEDDFAGSSTHLNDTDQVVAVQRNCYTMPSEPGWYQIGARLNGTGYGGNHVDSANHGTIRSHYFYICRCDSRQEAVTTLGPPPGQGGGGTATPTRTVTATSTTTATPRPGSTPTATDRSGRTSPTSTQSTSGPGTTATPTDGSGGDTPTALSTTGERNGTTGTGGTPQVEGPGFGAVVAVLGLLGAALLALRRTG